MFFSNKKKKLSEINFGFIPPPPFISPPPPPRSVEFQVIHELLNQMETWLNIRDKELEK
jgi:hypothetical protein